MDAKQLADFILDCPLQYELTLNDKKYLMAHAMTSHPDRMETPYHYLMGSDDESFYTDGIEGYISICGHSETGYFGRFGGTYSDTTHTSIWRNDKKNVIMIDCGCGFEDGILGCFCLDNDKEYYI